MKLIRLIIHYILLGTGISSHYVFCEYIKIQPNVYFALFPPMLNYARQHL